MSTQMGHSYTSYNHTDHSMGHIRRLRAELSNLLTPRSSKRSVDSVKKCVNVNCPSNQKTNRNVIFQPAGRYSENAGKTALTRRKSCPVGASNIVISRPWHSSQQKVRAISFQPRIILTTLQKITSEYPAQRTIHPKPNVQSSLSFSFSQTHPPTHRQLSRRHSDMSAVKRQESLHRRPRGSFLNTDAAVS